MTTKHFEGYLSPSWAPFGVFLRAPVLLVLRGSCFDGLSQGVHNCLPGTYDNFTTDKWRQY
jgi:hypothetical protein